MTGLPHDYGKTVLSVSNVSVTLGGMPVLRDLSLEVKNVHRPGVAQGQVVGLLGPSGMGKTTLFRILAGLDKPDTGTVLVEEEGRPVERGMVGVVAQNYPLFAHRTVLSNLAVAGRQAGLSAAQSATRANETLMRFGLEAHAKKYPALLSGGQRQRVAVAQQFMCSDHFLLMDEPFSGLDLLAKERVSDFIREMAASDDLKTIILVTHDIGSAVEVADTIWVLGRDRDAQGNVIPGARIQKTYDLIEYGLAWHEHIASMPEYDAVCREIRAIFPLL